MGTRRGGMPRASAGTLVQASLDGTIPPMPFNQIQCADLNDWQGDVEAPGWRKLLASVQALVAGRRPVDKLVRASRRAPAVGLRAAVRRT